jgi:hypothetical protein
MNNDELMHYGKKGMRWGARMAARNQSIKTARAKTAGLKDNRDEAQRDLDFYQRRYDKTGLGSDRVSMAKAHLAKTEKALLVKAKDVNRSNQWKTGEIVAASIVGAIGITAIGAFNKVTTGKVLGNP